MCPKCNNGVLSDLDKELCSKSPLAFLVLQHIGTPFQYIWDVDQGEKYLLETNPTRDLQGARLWPQAVFHRGEPRFHADGEEMGRVGPNRMLTAFHEHLRVAWWAMQHGLERKVWIWERIHNPPSLYPPRVFVRRAFQDFSPQMHFICRYANAADRNLVLRQVSRWRLRTKNSKSGVVLGSKYPAIRYSFDAFFVLRALVKIGLNILVWQSSGSFDPPRFVQAIEFVARGTSYTSPIWETGGFTLPSQVSAIRCPQRAHKFRLLFDRGWYYLVCVFFGGHMGATVKFPGPSPSDWRTLDVTAAMGSESMEAQPSSLLLPAWESSCPWPRLVTWSVSDMLPTLPFINERAKLTIVSRGATRRAEPSTM